MAKLLFLQGLVSMKKFFRSRATDSGIGVDARRDRQTSMGLVPTQAQIN